MRSRNRRRSGTNSRHRDNGIFVNQGPLSDRYGKGVLFIRENVENFGLWWYNSSYMALRAGLNE